MGAICHTDPFLTRSFVLPLNTIHLILPQDAGRLLYIGQNEWTHVNCAIWSAEVFEENDGSLKNVHAAVARGRQMVSRGLCLHPC